MYSKTVYSTVCQKSVLTELQGSADCPRRAPAERRLPAGRADCPPGTRRVPTARRAPAYRRSPHSHFKRVGRGVADPAYVFFVFCLGPGFYFCCSAPEKVDLLNFNFIFSFLYWTHILSASLHEKEKDVGASRFFPSIRPP